MPGECKFAKSENENNEQIWFKLTVKTSSAIIFKYEVIKCITPKFSYCLGNILNFWILNWGELY